MAPHPVRRSLHHAQRIPHHIEPATQLPDFAEDQLLKSISASLTLAGFDGIMPTALEMFRAHTEAYMLELLSHARNSMELHRRTTPTAQDFQMALARVPSARTASSLKPQLAIKLPEPISYPSIPDPPPAPAPTPDFSELLEPLLVKKPAYVPSHFPQLPAQHAWKETAVYPTREKDARRMREKATEEGMMAEQALRKLAAAAKVGVMKAESKRRTSLALAGVGKVRDNAGGRKRPAAEMLFDDVLNEVGASHGSHDVMALDGVSEGGLTQAEMEERVVVNSGMVSWRGGARHGLSL